MWSIGSNGAESLAQSVSKPTNDKKSMSLNKSFHDSRGPASSLIQSSQRKPSFHSVMFHAMSDDDSAGSSVDVGKGGSKFIKKCVQSVPDVQDTQSATQEKPCQLHSYTYLSVTAVSLSFCNFSV